MPMYIFVQLWQLWLNSSFIHSCFLSFSFPPIVFGGRGAWNVLYVRKGNFARHFQWNQHALDLLWFFVCLWTPNLEVDSRNLDVVLLSILGSALKTWGVWLLWRFGDRLGGGCHSSYDHILKTVGRGYTSTNLAFVWSRHSQMYQLRLQEYGIDMHVFGDVCS